MKIGYYLALLQHARDTRPRMFGAGLLLLLIALGFAAKPAYRAYRTYQVNRNLAAARTAVRHADWSTARDKAGSVCMARQSDFEAFRIWNHACCKLGEPHAFMDAARFFTDPRATREDRLEALRLMALQAPQAMVLRAYSGLPKALAQQADFRAAITPMLVRRGESAAAEKRLRALIRPDDGPAVRLELLRTLCQRPDVWRMAEARRIFADLIAAKADEQALAALLLLGEIPRALAPGLALPDLPAWLDSQPKATTLHHLTAMTPALEARPQEADAIYQSASDRFLATDPEVLGTWLVRHGQADMAARILSEPAHTRADAYIARLHALLHIDKAAYLTDALAHPLDAADPVEVEIVKAIHAAKVGDMIAADAAWTRAMNQAAFDAKRNRFIEIAHIAQVYGAKTAVLDAWVAACRLGWGPLPLYRDLLPVLRGLTAKGRSEDMLAIYRTLNHLEPGHPDLLNNLNYLTLLHGNMPADKVIAAQRKLVAQFPAQPEFNSTLIFAEMLAGQAADALPLLQPLRECKGVEPMMKLALEGCAKVLAGDSEAGSSVLQKVDWRNFMRQEKIVFSGLLAKSRHTELEISELNNVQPTDDPEKTPAWRKTIERLQKEQTGDVLPPLPAPRVKGSDDWFIPTS